MVDIGTRIKASITFNKIFVSAPVIVVSWRESSADEYCDYVYVDAADLNEKGFNAITTLSNTAGGLIGSRLDSKII